MWLVRPYIASSCMLPSKATSKQPSVDHHDRRHVESFMSNPPTDHCRTPVYCPLPQLPSGQAGPIKESPHLMRGCSTAWPQLTWQRLYTWVNAVWPLTRLWWGHTPVDTIRWSMLAWCWPSVEDDGPTPSQHWIIFLPTGMVASSTPSYGANICTSRVIGRWPP